MRPFALRPIALSLLTLALDRPVPAQVLDRVCPPDGAETVFARPTFAWTFGTENLLTNPSFEDGTNGWEISLGGVIITSPPNGAAEGINAFRISVGRISREVTLPAGDGGLSFSYALRGSVQLVGPDMVEIEPADGSEAPVKLPIAGFTSQARWTIHTADVSAHRGQTVRFTWSFPNADNVPWYLDDVRITPVTPDTEFEIWWRRNRAAEFELLERTSSPSVQFPELLPNVRHDWRVDVIRNGTTNLGSMMTFTTANAFGVETITGAPLPPVMCPDQPLSVDVRVTDERGFPARSAVVTLNFGAVGPNVNPPGVMITEVDTGVPDGVEFQNVSGQEIDVSGWQVELFRSTDTTVGGKITVPAGSVLAPGARFSIADRRPGMSPWPSLGVQVPMDWGERPGLPLSAGVILRNATGEVKDAVFVEPEPRLINGEPLPRNSRVVAPADWRTLPIASLPADGETYQRRGEVDQNVAADWAPAPRSFDQANAGMSNLFLPGFGALPVTPKGLTNARCGGDGWIQVPVRISGAGSNIVFQAQLRRPNPLGLRLWESNPFHLNPAACLQVSLPERVNETAGVLTGALQVQLPSPTSTNLTLQVSIGSDRLTAQGNLIIPAGQSQAVTDLIVANDSALTGPVNVAMTITAPGFSPAIESVIIDDDETTTLRWEVPDQIVEGSYHEALLILGRVVDADLIVALASSNPGRLSLPPLTFVPAGSDRTGISLTPADNTLLDGATVVELTASFANWPSAPASVSVVDNDTNAIDLLVNEPVIEGQTVELWITLGGGSLTNLPMTISVSNPERVLTPTEYSEFPAIGIGIVVPLRIVDDTEVTGREEVEVTVSLPGYVTGRQSFIIKDNDPGRLDLTQPLGPFYVGGSLGGNVQAQSVDGDPLPLVDLSSAVVSLVGEGSLSFIVDPINYFEGWHLLSVFPKTASSSARLRVEALGLSAETLPFSIWPMPTMNSVKWANYDAKRDRLIVIPESGTLFAVDASTGAGTDLANPLDDADFAVLSDDGDTLHVVHNERRRIARLNLSTMATEADWEAGMDSTERPLWVDHLAAIPGQPQSVVVCRNHLSPASPPEPNRLYDLVVFDGPTARSDRIPLEDRSYFGTTVIVPAGGTEAFLFERHQLFSYKLGPNGLSAGEASAGDFFGHDYGQESGTMIEALGTVLTRRGQWLDPRLPGELGYSSLGFDDDLFGFDPTRGVVAWFKSGERPVLRLLSPHNLQEITAQPLAPFERLNAPVVRLEPAGANRWLLVNNRSARLIPMVTPAPTPAIDLGVTATVTDRDEHLATARAVFRVTNLSSHAGAGVELSLGLPRGAYFGPRPAAYWLVDNATNAIRGPNALLGQMFQLGTLEPGASYEFPLVLPTFEPGEITVSAIVGSAALDPEPGNNRAEVRVTNLVAPAPVLRLLPTNPSEPDRLSFDFTAGYAHVYRIERARSAAGPWEDVLNQDVIANGEPWAFTADRSATDEAAYWRIRRTWPE